MILHSLPGRAIAVGGRRYHIRTDVRSVLETTEILQSTEMLPEDALGLAVWRLFRAPRPRAINYTSCIEAAFKALSEPPAYACDENASRVLDIEQDANLIIAAMRETYGIDIQREAGRIDWRVFSALLAGISSVTRLGQVMEIRGCKIPRWSPQNSDYIRELQKLKAEYAIRPRPGAGARSYDDGLKHLAMVLTEMADEGCDT